MSIVEGTRSIQRHQDEAGRLAWLIDRQPGACVIETDARGIFTHFGPGAEALFGCPAQVALGKLHYGEFHDAEQLEACQGRPEFREALLNPGWTEDRWRVIPRVGEPFEARVTLVPLRAGSSGADSGEIVGWRALYRRIGPSPG